MFLVCAKSVHNPLYLLFGIAPNENPYFRVWRLLVYVCNYFDHFFHAQGKLRFLVV